MENAWPIVAFFAIIVAALAAGHIISVRKNLKQYHVVPEKPDSKVMEWVRVVLLLGLFK